MQVFGPLDQENAALVGWGVRVLLLTDAPTGMVAARLAGLGGVVETEGELFASLAAVIDDPLGYGLYVMDCDAFGGIETGKRAAVQLVGAGMRVPVILISKECRAQSFPEDSTAPILLRAPLSAVALRVGFEHALRHRMLWRAA